MVYAVGNYGQTMWNNIPPGLKRAAALGAMSYVGNRFRGPGQGTTINTREGNNVVVHKARKFKRRGTFRNKLLANSAAKHYNTIANQDMTHGTIYTYMPTAGILQGTTEGTRIGDSVSLEALKLRGFLLSPAPANAYSFRILVGWTGEEYNTVSADLVVV